MGWLAGCWEQIDGDRTMQEQWMRPLGSTMIGIGRTVVEGETADYEHLRIEEKEGTLVYIAAPSGQQVTAFQHIELTDSTVVFANPEHDSPQRISYRLLPDGSLPARIEGDRAGATRVIDFTMCRIPCDDR